MVQAFVVRRLDYCNALCYGVTDELTRYLQSVQNAAAQRIVFKIATLVHRPLSGNAPGYLACRRRPCQTTVFCRHSNTRCQSDAQHFWSWTFAAAGPRVWNSLPPNLTTTWAVIRPVHAVTEDSNIRTVRPRRSVNCFNCAE